MTARALGFSTLNGLPAHILIVHAVVVFVPLSALGLVASLHTPTARRLGTLMPVAAAIALVSVLAAMNAGGWLQNHVENTALVRRHTQLGGQLWPFSIGVFVMSVVVWWLARQRAMVTASAREVPWFQAAAVGVLSVVVAVISVVQVVRIGESGSRAAWHDHFSRTALHQSGS